MEFLLASRQRNRRRLRLEEWLLLALRTLAVLLIGLAVAGPRSARAVLPVGPRPPADTVVVVDDSASMGLKRGAGTVFGAVRDELAGRVAELPPADRLAIYRTSDAGEPWHALARPDREALARRVEALTASDTHGGLAEALAAGRAALFGSTNLRRLVVLSDFRRVDWTGPAGQALRAQLTALTGDGVEVTLLDFGRAESANLTLESLRLVGPHAVAQTETQLAVTIRNAGSAEARDVPLHVRVGEVELPVAVVEAIGPGTSQTVEVPLVLPRTGPEAIRAALPADALEADNAATLALEVREALTVLIFDGHYDPADVRHSESYFLRAALEAARQGGLNVRAEVRPAEALAGADLTGVDLVVLANVPDLPAELDGPGQLRRPALEALVRHVRAGGGLAVFTGDRVNLEFYNGPMLEAGLAPLPMAPAVGDATGRERAVSLQPDSAADLEMLRAFRGETQAFARMVRFYRYHRASERSVAGRPADATAPRVLLRFADGEGSPAMVESRLGDGGVLYVYSTAGDRWNDWGKSINFTYLPVMVDLVSYLARPGGREHTAAVGSAIVHPVPASPAVTEATLKTPAYPAQDLVSLPVQLAEGAPAGLLRYDRPRQAGLYELTLRGPGLDATALYARNVEPAEGDLAKPSPAERAALTGEGVTYVDRTGPEAAQADALAGGRAFAPWLFALALAMLACEGVLAQRFGHYGPGELRR